MTLDQVGSNVVGTQSWVYEHWFAPLAAPTNASLAYALCYVAL